MTKTIDYPVYRKYTNGSNFFKISDDRNWLELQLVGKKIIRFEVVAQQFPEIIRLREMLCQMAPFEYCSEAEFNAQFKKVKSATNESN